MAIILTPFPTINIFKITNAVFDIENTDYLNTDVICDIYIRSSANDILYNNKKYNEATEVYDTLECPVDRILLEDYNNLILNENPSLYTEGFYRLNLEPFLRSYKEKYDIINGDIYMFLQFGTIKKIRKGINNYPDISLNDIQPNLVRFPSGSAIATVVNNYDSDIYTIDRFTNKTYKIAPKKISSTNFSYNIYFNFSKSTITTLTPNFTLNTKVYNNDTNTLLSNFNTVKTVNRYGTRTANISDSYINYIHDISTTSNILPNLRFELSVTFFGNILIVYSDNQCNKFKYDNLIYLNKSNGAEVVPIIKKENINLEFDKDIFKTSKYNIGNNPIRNASDVNYSETYEMLMYNIKKIDIDKYFEILSSTKHKLEENNTFRDISILDVNFDILTYENNKSIESINIKYKYN